MSMPNYYITGAGSARVWMGPGTQRETRGDTAAWCLAWLGVYHGMPSSPLEAWVAKARIHYAFLQLGPTQHEMDEAYARLLAHPQEVMDRACQLGWMAVDVNENALD